MIACTAILAAGCNSNEPKEDKPAAAAEVKSDAAVKYDYPYKLDKPYQNWQAGNQQHAITVMKSLKAFEAGDMTAAVAGFGDTVELRFDNYRARVSNDSLKKIFTDWRAQNASVVIKMDDWEPVISEDKKEEWVTLWYKEIHTDKKGKVDSLATIDDCKMVNGKIVVLDEKIQHYPAPAKK